MTPETTSPTTDNVLTISPARSLRGEWGNYWRFIMRPALPHNATGIGIAPIAATLRLFLLDIVVMIGLIILASAAMAAGFEPPANVFDAIEWSGGMMIAAVFLIPFAEEVAFRGWLSGRPAAIVGMAVLAAGLLTAYWLSSDGGLIGLPFAIVGIAGAVIVSALLRKRAPFHWFTRFFPLMFWFSTIAFAALHMVNYSEGSVLDLLPLVLPQFVSGSIFGYARVTYGLWSSVTLHTLHNGIIIGSIVSAMPAGG